MKEFLFSLGLFFIWIASAHAQWGVEYISNDKGGVLDDYIAKYKMLKQVGTPVVLSGECVSACTMVLMLPRSQVCAMPGAVLGFHSAYLLWHPVPSVKGTAQMTQYYPPAVRKWFYSKPLSLNLRYRRATDFFPPCH